MGWVLHGEFMSKKTFISIGECMAELQLARDGLAFMKREVAKRWR